MKICKSIVFSYPGEKLDQRIIELEEEFEVMKSNSLFTAKINLFCKINWKLLINLYIRHVKKCLPIQNSLVAKISKDFTLVKKTLFVFHIEITFTSLSFAQLFITKEAPLLATLPVLKKSSGKYLYIVSSLEFKANMRGNTRLLML